MPNQIMNNSAIKKHLLELFNLDNDAIHQILDFSEYMEYKKGDILIQEGKRHPYFYFIIKGAVKSYYHIEDREICSWFAFENEMVATIKTFAGETSNETIELLEDTTFIKIQTEKFKKLADNDLTWSHIMSALISSHAIFLEDRIKLQFMPGKERYNKLIQSEPQILQRVSLTDISSFLGMSRENLSRIRSEK